MVLATMGPSGWADPVSITSTAAKSGSKADYSSLAEQIWNQAQVQRVPALGLLIFDKGRLVAQKAFGQTTNLATPFRWGSITKTLTALAVLRTIEQGGHSLSDPLADHLAPEVAQLAFTNPHPQPLRVHHLLELTAGLTDLSAVEWASARPLTRRAALALNPAARYLHWPPGMAHSYSNSAPGLSALFVEAATGLAFEDYLAREVFDPLGMQGASLHPVPGLPGGFRADGSTPIPYWHMTFPAFGALNATLPQLQRLLLAALNDGYIGERRVLSEFELKHLTQPQTGLAAQAGLKLGYASGLYGRISAGQVWWSHGGDADGYRSRYALHPESGRGYLLVINTDNRPLIRRLSRRLERALAADMPQRHVPQVPLHQGALQAYAGNYYPSTTRFGLATWQAGAADAAQIIVQKQQLVFVRNGRSTQLYRVRGNQFRRASDPVASVIFIATPDGELHLQGELGNFRRQ